MDNREFDKKLQEKLSKLTPAYDAKAWDSLKYRLDLMAPMPWYAKWKSVILAGALAMFTLINLTILWQVRQDKEIVSELLNQNQIEKPSLFTDTLTVYDTVRIYDQYNTKTGSDDLLAYNSSSPITSNSAAPLAFSSSNGTAANGAGLADVNSSSALSLSTRNSNYYVSQVPHILTVMVPVGNSEDAGFFTTLDDNADQAIGYYGLDHSLELLESKSPLALNPDPIELNFDQRYLHPTPTIVRKQRKPLNLRAGLTAGLLIPDPHLGERFISSRLGVKFETPINRDLYLHTGVNFQHIIYKLNDVDDEQFDQTDLSRFPEYNTFTDSPDKIKTDNTIVQIPLHLRYYGALNNRWSVYVGGGPTIDMVVQQKFTYSFITINQNKLEEFDKTVKSDQTTINLGAIAGEFGLSHNFTRQLSGQIGLNYQYGIGKLGLEKRSFNSLSFNAGLLYQIGRR